MKTPFTCRCASVVLFAAALAAVAPADEVPVAPEVPAGPEDAIWIEGENATRKDVVSHPWYGNAIKREPLSGGNWLSHFNDKRDGTAAYEFTVARAGEYAFWVRSNPVQLGVDWQLDGGPWKALDTSDVRGQQNLADNDKPDLRFIAWIGAGRLRLTEGRHTLTFRLYGHGNKGGPHHGAIDCLVLTRVPFSPQGARKPCVAGESRAGDWFPLVAGDDPFAPGSVTDMSRLVPAPAGELGVLQAAGDQLRFEKAAGPFKIWGCGANLETGRYTPEQMEQRAKYLRKAGINCVRQHPLFDDIATDGKIDPKKFDEYDRWFAVLKKHGIYSGWSVFYHFPIAKDDGYAPELFAELVPLNKAGTLRDSYGLITISAPLLEIRHRVLIDILTHKNPYTGLRYVDDPALAIVEMQNEDSVFFWNPLGALHEGKKWPHHTKLLKRAWWKWVKDRYGTDEAVRKAWGRFDETLAARMEPGLPAPDGSKDAPAPSGELKIHSPWEIGRGGADLKGALAGQPRRAGDYTRFLAEMQRAFFAQWEKRVRDTGFRGVTMTTAWHAGAQAQEAANIWCDTVGSMMDRHSYAGGGKGDHVIVEGEVRNGSHLDKPGAYLFSIASKQVADKPMCVSEWTMCAPTQWKLECAPVFAFYGMGLQGWDASFHFVQSGTRLGDGWPQERWYATDTPHYIGQFPALAFALAKGHIQESPPVLLRRIADADMFSGTDAMTDMPEETFARGREAVTFARSGDIPVAAVSPDEPATGAARVLNAVTGEMTWDADAGVVTVQAPKTQAVIGRVMDQTIALPGVTASFKTPFVSVLFTPLDDVPLADSRLILVTALARDRQTGASYSEDGAQLLKKGAAPLLLEPVQASLRFAGAKPARVRALDHYGYPLREVPVAADGTIAIDGRWRACYYAVER